MIAFREKKVPQSIATVPPGQGKRSTQQRNLRRRRKKLATKGLDANQSEIEEEHNSQSAPMGSFDTGGLDPLSISMLSNLSNANKKRGFKQTMTGVTPKHSYFMNGNATSSSPTKLNRIIPPSERTDLPRNMIVTSVDVEADLWGSVGHRNSSSKSLAPTAGASTRQVTFDWATVESNWEKYAIISQSDITLNATILWKVSYLIPLLILALTLR